MEKSRGRLSGITIVSMALLFAAALLLAAAKSIDGFAGWYSVNIYSLITATLGRLTGCVPFSVAEAAVCVLPFAILADILICRKKNRKASLHILLVASILFFMYAANCGVNYSRDTFVDRQALAEAEFTEDQLVDLCESIITRIEASGPETDYPHGGDLSAGARQAMYDLSEQYPSLKGYYPAPKELAVLSGAFSGMGVSGIYSPFTVEANINGAMPDMEKPFTACHELSHLRGYMNEGEANYIGWLACISSEDPSFNRSGWLIAWMHAGGALKRIDPERYDELCKKLPADAASEIDACRQFWASHEGKASEIQDRVNDAYLKANGQKDGIRSYGMLTTLMLMYYTER